MFVFSFGSCAAEGIIRFTPKNVVLKREERGGSVRSFHIDSASIADIAPILRANIKRESSLMTDQARHYRLCQPRPRMIGLTLDLV